MLLFYFKPYLCLLNEDNLSQLKKKTFRHVRKEPILSSAFTVFFTFFVGSVIHCV